jgi:hypothetical protein
MNWKEHLQGFHNAAALLIRRGTAMGPLIPALSLSPAFLLGAWMFRGNEVLCWFLILAAVGIVAFYFRHYERYAKTAPDRLQSEEYRCEMTRLNLIAAKELPVPMPVEALNLSKPMFNPSLETPNIQHVEGEV